MNKHVRTWAIVGLLGAVAVGVTVASLATGGLRIAVGDRYGHAGHGATPGQCGGGCGAAGKCGHGGQCAHAEAPAGQDTTRAFANTTCPIMGSPIDPKNVAPELVRMHKGKHVAFCCGGCPAAWDKLSEAVKEAKLQEAAGGKTPG